jgi:DNA-binding transcriptional LysR family regulator
MISETDIARSRYSTAMMGPRQVFVKRVVWKSAIYNSDIMSHLDSDQLRTFLAIAEAGSVTGGAVGINRSQSAASLQIRQLEEIVGRPLFRRHGRGVTLTAAGEQLLPVARQVTQSLDTTLADLRGKRLKGKLRMGVTDDHSRSALVRIIADFASRHPDVELEVHCALGAGMESALDSGDLDVAVFEAPEPARGDEVLREDRLVWMCSRDHDLGPAEILPVAVFDRDCWWRDVALSGLEAAGRRYRVAFTSESTVGVRAAVRAGIAAGLLRTASDTSGLVPLPGISFERPSFLVLRRAPGADGDVCDAMRETIRKAF